MARPNLRDRESTQSQGNAESAGRGAHWLVLLIVARSGVLDGSAELDAENRRRAGREGIHAASCGEQGQSSGEAGEGIAGARCMMSMRFAPNALICDGEEPRQRPLSEKRLCGRHLDENAAIALLERRALRLADVEVLSRVALAVLDEHCAHRCHGERRGGGQGDGAGHGRRVRGAGCPGLRTRLACDDAVWQSALQASILHTEPCEDEPRCQTRARCQNEGERLG